MTLNTWTTNKEVAVTTQERHLWFVLRLFYCLVRASRCFFLPSLRRGRCFFLPSVRPFLLFETLTLSLPHPHSEAKPLHSYKIALSATSVPSELQKILPQHPPLMPRLRRQVYVSGQRVLRKHFRLEFSKETWYLSLKISLLSPLIRAGPLCIGSSRVWSTKSEVRAHFIGLSHIRDNPQSSTHKKNIFFSQIKILIIKNLFLLLKN